jgi:endonuclease YncB( thermonuclease family)
MRWVDYCWALRETASANRPRSTLRSSVRRSPFPRALLFFLAAGVAITSGAENGLASDQAEGKPNSTSPTSQWIEGKVMAIVDGDTFHLAAEDGKYVVDLAGIDAPEKGQPSGDMAAQVLHLKVLEKQVKVLIPPASSPSPVVRPITPTPTTSPPFSRSTGAVPLRRRVCGIVYSDGCVNSDLVREGLAWHDAKRCPSTALSEAEAMARKGHRGLWRGDEEPIPPWQWRRERPTRAASPSGSASQSQQVRDLSRLFEARTPAAAMEAAAQVQRVVSLSAEAAPQTPGPVASGSYWLTTSSGIRHNGDCRYFGKSKGRKCSATEGRPCQKCGG